MLIPNRSLLGAFSFVCSFGFASSFGCASEDMYGAEGASLESFSSATDEASYVIDTDGGRRWFPWQGRLTYRLEQPGTLPGLRPDLVRAMVRNAFGQWEKAAPLRFVETTSATADIVFRFEDLPLLQYASSGPPPCLLSLESCTVTPTTGEIILNSALTWTLEPGNGDADGEPVTITTILLHEIGHALGLFNEDSVPGAIMSSTPSFDQVSLGEDDIAGVQAIYGDLQVRGVPYGEASQTETEIQGWAYDPDASRGTAVRIEAHAGDIVIASVTANESHGDLADGIQTPSENHGFSIAKDSLLTFETDAVEPGDYELKLFAVSFGEGADTELSYGGDPIMIAITAPATDEPPVVNTPPQSNAPDDVETPEAEADEIGATATANTADVDVVEDEGGDGGCSVHTNSALPVTTVLFIGLALAFIRKRRGALRPE